MNEAEIRRLLSEYAAGSISDADRRILFQEALENQSVFESLAAEQPLADLMSDAAARSELRAALVPEGYRGLMGWLRRPWPIAAAATVAVALLAVFVSHRMEKPVQIAETPASSQRQQTPPTLPAQSPELDKVGSRTTAENELSSPAMEAARPALQPKREEASSNVSLPASPVVTGRLADSRRNQMIAAQPEESARNEPPAALPAPAVAESEGGKSSSSTISGIDRSSEFRKSNAEVASRTGLAQRAAVIEKGKSLTAVGPAIRYEIERQGTDGRLDEVPAGTIFHAGEEVRLQLVPEVSGYLAVAELGANGVWQVLFPVEGDRAVRVAGFSTILLPSSGFWKIDPSLAERRLLVVFTREPQGALLSAQGVVHRPAGGTVREIVLRTGR